MIDEQRAVALYQWAKALSAKYPINIVLRADKTCATCVHSTSPDPKCGLCAGPTQKTSRYQPIPVKKD